MILVLEGPMGAGKTVLASRLSRRLSWPLYRPFRSDHTGHSPGIEDKRLIALAPRLPINSWQEDIYTADVLGALKPDVILDRSLPSGLAWDQTGLDENQRQAAIGYWAERIAAGGGTIVLLTAPYPVRQRRAGFRANDWEYEEIRSACDWAASKLQLLKLDTSVLDVDGCADKICSWLDAGIR